MAQIEDQLPAPHALAMLMVCFVKWLHLSKFDGWSEQKVPFHQWVLDLLGLEPRTYRMLSDRSTTGAPNPCARSPKIHRISSSYFRRINTTLHKIEFGHKQLWFLFLDVPVIVHLAESDVSDTPNTCFVLHNLCWINGHHHETSSVAAHRSERILYKFLFSHRTDKLPWVACFSAYLIIAWGDDIGFRMNIQ